jgi:hypothetical protein
MGRLTTHVLDTARGCPAAGMAFALHLLGPDGSRRELCRGVTNHDGRADAPCYRVKPWPPAATSWSLTWRPTLPPPACPGRPALPGQRPPALRHCRHRRPLPRAAPRIAVELLDLPGQLMDAYLIEWGSLLLRWLHLIVGIAWIGSSFYFVWLDNSLKPPWTRPSRPRAWAASCGRCTAAASTTRRNTWSPRPTCRTSCTGSNGRAIPPGCRASP